MADVSRSVEIIFGAVDNTSKTLSQIETGISSLQSATQPVANFTTSLLKTEAAIVAVGTAALAYAFGAAVELENAQTDLRKVLGDSESDFDSYAATIKEMSGTFAILQGDVTQTVTIFKQAGFSIEDSLTLSEAALTSMAIAGLSAEQSSSLLKSTIKGFALEAEDAARIVDIWNEAENKAGVSTVEFSQALAQISPIAKLAGISIEEAGGLVTPIIQIFGSGSEAANALKSGLLSLASNTKPVVDTLAELGISQSDANGEMRSANDILIDLSGKWTGLTEEQRLNTAGIIFGKQQAGKMSTVLEQYNTVLKSTEIFQKAAGSATAELAIKFEATQFVIDKTSASFNNLVTTVGQQYKTEVSGLIGSTGELAGAFDKLIATGGLEPLFEALRPFINEAADSISEIAKNLPEAFEGVDFGPIVDGAEKIKEAFGTLFDDIDLGSVEGLNEAIQKTVNFIGNLEQFTAGAIRGLEPIIDAVQGIASGFADADESSADFIGEIFGSITTLNKFLGVLGGATSILSGLGDAALIVLASDKLGGLGSIATKAAGGVTALQNVSTTLAASLTKAGPAMQAFALSGAAIAGWEAGTALYNSSQAVRDLSGSMVASLDSIFNFTDGGYDAIKAAEAMTASFDKAGPKIEDFGNALKDSGDTSDLIEGVNGTLKPITGLSEALDEVNSLIAKTGDETSLSAKELEGFAKKVEKDISVVNKVIGGAANELIGFTDATGDTVLSLGRTSEAAGEASKDLEKVAEKTEAMEIALLELASNEKIAAMEFTADIKVADIEAQSAQAVAAIDSLGESITANSQLLGDLFATDAPDWDRFGFDMRSAADDANDRLNDLNDVQIDLIRKQALFTKAKTDRLRDGGGDITIDSTGLEVSLEQFMMEVLKKIRVKVLNDEAEFLFGLT